jgi:rare lipoprotein A
MTAAHRTLPFGTMLRVCRIEKCALVRINDRGPYVRGRVLDLSQAAADLLGMRHRGVAYLRIERLS